MKMKKNENENKNEKKISKGAGRSAKGSEEMMAHAWMKMLCKLFNSEHKSVDSMLCEYTKVLYDLEAVVMGLMCEVLEKMGYNPIDTCRDFRNYLIYHHFSCVSDVAGSRVEKGVLIDADGNETKTEMYYAKENGKEFLQTV